jgi:hypothetical protein
MYAYYQVKLFFMFVVPRIVSLSYYKQRDAALSSLYLLRNHSTCFG